MSLPGYCPIAERSITHRKITNSSPTTRYSAAGRWLLLHATHLRGSLDDDIAVIIEPAHPSRNAPLMLSSLGLTPRESKDRSAKPA
jgi:hypothetical protein